MGGFGRKGLEGQPSRGMAYHPSHPGQSGLEGLRNTARGPFQTQPRDSQMSRKLEAFVAAERAQRSESGLSEAATSHRDTARPERSLALAYLLWFILGQVSAHRFYLGAYRSAIAQVSLLAVAVLIAVNRLGSSHFGLGVIMAVVIVAWALWVLGDVFFIHRIHRKLCRKAGDAAAAFA